MLLRGNLSQSPDLPWIVPLKPWVLGEGAVGKSWQVNAFLLWFGLAQDSNLACQPTPGLEKIVMC